jgi:hypothetical protein
VAGEEETPVATGAAGKAAGEETVEVEAAEAMEVEAAEAMEVEAAEAMVGRPLSTEWRT